MVVDIVMPVRNGERFVEAAVEGLQRQSERAWRLIALDHGSTDGTLPILQRLAAADKRIELFDGSAYPSVALLRNWAFRLCDAPVIILQDADDISRPNRIIASLRAFDDNPDAVAIGGQADLIDADGRPVGHMARYVDRDRISAASLFCNPIAHPTVAFRREGVEQFRVAYGVDFLGAVFPENQEVMPTLVEDYLLFGQLAMIQKLANMPETLIDYRVHNQSTSFVHRKKQVDLALFVSRFLSRSIAALRHQKYVDPAALCNHCGLLFSLPSATDSEATYRDMSQVIRQVFGTSNGVERELSYRRSIATRNSAALLARHLAFRARHRPEADEAVAVREWFVGPLRGRPRTPATADA